MDDYMSESYRNYIKRITDKIVINKARKSGKQSAAQEYSYRQSIMTANCVIHQNNDGEVVVLKDRSGNCIDKELSNYDIIELLSSMMIDHLFKNNMKLFKDTKKEEILKVIMKVIQGGDD